MNASTQSSHPWEHPALSSPVLSPPSLPTAPSLSKRRTARLLRSFYSLGQRLLATSRVRFQVKSPRLKLQETVQLGEKRFVAILRVDGEEFLLGGGPATVSLLAQLHRDLATNTFSTLLDQHRAQEEQA